jgi:hypothetical protein
LFEENNFLKNELVKLKNNYNVLKNNYRNFKTTTNKSIDSLKQITRNNLNNIEKTANSLGVKIETAEEKTNKSISNLNSEINKTTLYWIIAALFLLIMLLVVFILLRKQIFKHKSDIESNIRETRKSLEEESIKLDEKLISLLENKLKTKAEDEEDEDEEPDHSLALRVADEIIRIQKNISRMDKNTKGLKQLSRSVERIQNEFAANGYEIIDLLDQPFNEGMNITANFILDENLKQGERIITRIIKPQVNYKGIMIQQAQVEISQGE